MSSKKGQPSKDPYDVLGISSTATNSEITKAYRKLALKLHPDKQRPGLKPEEAEEVAKRFHDIKEARSFLLDAEHAEDRRAFDARRESERIRKEADAKREQHMSERRKRMRDELKEKEARAARDAASSSAKKRQRKGQDDKDLVDQLRREGQKRREEQAERELERQLRKERKDRKDQVEERQIRLKWDRKKIKISPSEDSIATLLSAFGSVEHVEFLGSKGNQALVTFAEASSCRPCVDAYAASKEMRAKFVGKRKDREEEDEIRRQQIEAKAEADVAVTKSRHRNETLEERRLRQATEREALLRQMEEEEETELCSAEKSNTASNASSQTVSKGVSNTFRTIPFPIPFPEKEDLQMLGPFGKLQVLEESILRGILPSEKLRSLRMP